MRRHFAVLVVPLLLAGCLGNLTCPDCAAIWTFEGVDDRLYEQMGAAMANGTLPARETVPLDVTQFRHPRLDEAWGEYSLVQVDWTPDGPEPAGVAARGAFEGGVANLSVSARDDAPESSVRERAEAFLAQITTLDESQRGAWVDAMLANRTSVGSGQRSQLLDDGSYRNETYETHARFAILPPDALDVARAFALATADRAWEPEESSSVNAGAVRVDDWTFVFWWPLRSATLDLPDVRVHLQASEHGTFIGTLELRESLREHKARRALEAALASRGVDVDIDAWTLRGQGSGASFPWSGAAPTPTPTNVRTV